MPTSTKSAMAGTKRKSAPTKNARVNESKKPKTDSGNNTVLKTKTKPIPGRKVEESSDEDSDVSDVDGGSPLTFDSNESDPDNNVEGDIGVDGSDSEEIPNVSDGLHPERAVVINSRNFDVSFKSTQLTIIQVSLRRKPMPSKSNWFKKEKPRSLWQIY